MGSILELASFQGVSGFKSCETKEEHTLKSTTKDEFSLIWFAIASILFVGRVDSHWRSVRKFLEGRKKAVNDELLDGVSFQ